MRKKDVMKKYKIAYAKVNNAGDLFNEGLMSYFGIEFSRTSIIGADVVMLGGLLSTLISSNSVKVRAKQEIWKLIYDINKPLHVWGSGFLVDDVYGKYMRNNLCIHALRGALTKKKLESDLNILIGEDVVLADPGLLAREFIDEKAINKKYTIGVIPHFREKHVELINRLPEKYSNATLIDICKPYQEVLKSIAECDCIISSSLHGLIFADSLGIPNIHVVASDNLKGNGFKFRDYYSSFSIESNPFILDRNSFPSLQEIHDNYLIQVKDVEEKISGLLRSFPRNI